MLAAVACAALTNFASGAHASTVTFDDLTPSGNAIQSNVTSGGFDFNGGHFHIIDSADTRLVSSGNFFLTAEASGGLGGPVTMSSSTGALFTLNGLDVAELWLPNDTLNDFQVVSLTGNRFGGGVLNASIRLDGIRDGVGGANDFQTVSLAGWTNLTSVTFSGHNSSLGFGDYSIDNISVTAVPEPGAWGLALAGFGVLALRRRRQIL
ncbi:MAG: PEP-CTERM sorting domain-containing protein [Rubrivivax sp.]|nr:MAG: PEP-CTERM sorting domain-containing protein [Rubrivivax sp.]